MHGILTIHLPFVALAYREASKRGWRTEGIASMQASEYVCYNVDHKMIVGEKWGDESSTFLSAIDFLVRVGGGPQALQETKDAKDMGIGVIEYDLPQTTR